MESSTPELKYYSKVVTLLREQSINYSPDWSDVIKYMKEGKTSEETAFEFVAIYDVD